MDGTMDDDGEGEDEEAGEDADGDVVLLEDLLVHVGGREEVQDFVADEEEDDADDRVQDRDQEDPSLARYSFHAYSPCPVVRPSDGLRTDAGGARAPPAAGAARRSGAGSRALSLP